MKADSITVIDPRGQLLLSTRIPFGSPLPQVDVKAWRSRLRNDGRSYVSNMMHGPVLGKPMFAVGTTVSRPDGSTVMLNATVAPSQMDDLLREQKFPDSWRVAIIDGTGTIVARSHDAERYVGFKASPDLMKRLFVNPEDGFRGVTGIYPAINQFLLESAALHQVGASFPGQFAAATQRPSRILRERTIGRT